MAQNCKKCNEEFTQPKHIGNSYLYCPKCRKTKANKSNHTCIYCGKEFKHKKFSSHSHNNFCGERCLIAYEIALYQSRNHKQTLKEFCEEDN
jgi:hypothetical protein